LDLNRRCNRRYVRRSKLTCGLVPRDHTCTHYYRYESGSLPLIIAKMYFGCNQVPASALGPTLDVAPAAAELILRSELAKHSVLLLRGIPLDDQPQLQLPDASVNRKRSLDRISNTGNGVAQPLPSSTAAVPAATAVAAPLLRSPPSSPVPTLLGVGRLASLGGSLGLGSANRALVVSIATAVVTLRSQTSWMLWTRVSHYWYAQHQSPLPGTVCCRYSVGGQPMQSRGRVKPWCWCDGSPCCGREQA
jgi:hypothetical protein